MADGGTASCVKGYSPEEVNRVAFAFDGTVNKIGPGTTNRQGMGQLDTAAVTFSVNRWWRGGTSRTVTVDVTAPTSEDGPPSYERGTRLLVSGQPRWGGAPLQDALAWGCGFTRYYDTQTASEWTDAFA